MTGSKWLRGSVMSACIVVSAAAAGQTQMAVEYYYAAWNYYFVTSFPDEIQTLDSGAFGGVWKRTGQTFNVWSQPIAGSVPACRFFSTAFAPKSSHFYTPSSSECETVQRNANWQYEAIAFHMQLPTAAGGCPNGTTILYRLYNNGMGGAPNHRYTTSSATFNQMRAAGWVFEGNQSRRDRRAGLRPRSSASVARQHEPKTSAEKCAKGAPS